MTQKLELRKETLIDNSVVYWIYLGSKIIECFHAEERAIDFFNNYKIEPRNEVVLKTREISNGPSHFSEEELMSL